VKKGKRTAIREGNPNDREDPSIRMDAGKEPRTTNADRRSSDRVVKSPKNSRLRTRERRLREEKRICVLNTRTGEEGVKVRSPLPADFQSGGGEEQRGE